MKLFRTELKPQKVNGSS
ncbi:hypothetical protein F383_14537 [Gossypium arboreum]|uniref:Uncharacterized protein n=1 Tax=Gossypium arboreum TaxID=29729 RepID=A0A0B0P9D2_GOSAR|nr:hypothetical protein F383_25401 [Gossypium arboreum]KHG30345.1 hypothetical protein F383_14537 [Gossypium arboreum]